MNVTHDSLYAELRTILEKNIHALTSFLESSNIANDDEVKLFFKNKARNRNLFNEKLMSELNMVDDTFTEAGSPETLVGSSDEVLLIESLKTDNQTLKDFEALLKQPTLPLSIRLIIKEQIIFFRLDELKMKQLTHIL